jgi:hypothetical protein
MERLGERGITRQGLLEEYSKDQCQGYLHTLEKEHPR